ncbi:MAG: AAA-like domain-containing protein [Bacteroidota bacterium]
MEKFFNTAGPIKTDLHYYVPTESRWDLERVLGLIRQQKYFILHAPRQTGKTSAILSLTNYLNDSGEYEAIYANIEAAQAVRSDVEKGIRTVMAEIASRMDYFLEKSLLKENWLRIFEESGASQALAELLTFWTIEADKPTILFLDEVDALIGDTLISLLRQIRSGYDKRPSKFPISIVLCGVRDVRDYRMHSASSGEIITGGSAFNIKAESLRLENFSKEQIQELYKQHTNATGQIFEAGVLDLVWHYTEGQPWLVNALAYEATYNMKDNQDRSKPLTNEIFRTAKERLILRRDTHLDQLADKLREERVKRIIQPILSGKKETTKHRPDDVQYVRDLGLIHLDTNGKIQIANDIYKEIIPRELSWVMQTGIAVESNWYITKEGKIDMSKLLTAFQDFFRKHSEHWVERFDYKEAGPQLLLQAFLQRIVNGGGRIEREYGFGRGRTDLFIEFFYGEHKKQEIVLELKLLYNNLEKTIEEGIQQTKRYMDKCGAKEGHLLVFDRRADRTWEEKIWQKEIDSIQVWGA